MSGGRVTAFPLSPFWEPKLRRWIVGLGWRTALERVPKCLPTDPSITRLAATGRRIAHSSRSNPCVHSCQSVIDRATSPGLNGINRVPGGSQPWRSSRRLPKTMRKKWIIGYYSCYVSFTPTSFPRDHPFNPEKVIFFPPNGSSIW